MVPYQKPSAENIKVKGIHLTNTAVNSSYAAESDSSSSGSGSGSGSGDESSDEDDYAGNGCKRLMTDVFQELKVCTPCTCSLPGSAPRFKNVQSLRCE